MGILLDAAAAIALKAQPVPGGQAFSGHWIAVVSPVGQQLLADTANRADVMLSVPANAWQDFLTRVR
jgi:hypothetical protein